MLSRVFRVPAFVMVVCLFSIVFGAHSALAGLAESYIPDLPVVGDVENPLVLQGLDALPFHSVTYRDRVFEGISLAELVAQVQPLAATSSVFYVAADLVAEVSVAQLAQSYLTFSATHGWEVVNLAHPVSSNIKRLQEIVVVGKEDRWDFGVNVISPEENLRSVSVGALHTSGHWINLAKAGAATRRHDEEDYAASVYTRAKALRLADLVGSQPVGTALVVGAKGEMQRYAGGWFVLRPNSVDFVADGRQGTIADVQGVIVDAPGARITDAYHDALHFLRSGESVLLVMLDGLGYHQYTYARDQGIIPFLSGLGPATRALSVYQPVTNAGLAAILTGVGPDENGVYSRDQRMLQAPDVFAAATTMGKESAYIVGDRQIIRVSIDPVFNLDRNASGSTDDEITETAAAMAEEGVDLLVVHLKDIDRAGHNYGDMDPRTMAAIAETDGYLEAMISPWRGRVIVTVDHGMHETEDGGDHGTLRFEDMFVPYIISQGGGQ